jgi:hypothetical protein
MPLNLHPLVISISSIIDSHCSYKLTIFASNLNVSADEVTAISITHTANTSYLIPCYHAIFLSFQSISSNYSFSRYNYSLSMIVFINSLSLNNLSHSLLFIILLIMFILKSIVLQVYSQVMLFVKIMIFIL